MNDVRDLKYLLNSAFLILKEEADSRVLSPDQENEKDANEISELNSTSVLSKLNDNLEIQTQQSQNRPKETEAKLETQQSENNKSDQVVSLNNLYDQNPSKGQFESKKENPNQSEDSNNDLESQNNLNVLSRAVNLTSSQDQKQELIQSAVSIPSNSDNFSTTAGVINQTKLVQQLSLMTNKLADLEVNNEQNIYKPEVSQQQNSESIDASNVLSISNKQNTYYEPAANESNKSNKSTSKKSDEYIMIDSNDHREFLKKFELIKQKNKRKGTHTHREKSSTFSSPLNQIVENLQRDSDPNKTRIELPRIDESIDDNQTNLNNSQTGDFDIFSDRNSRTDKAVCSSRVE